MLMSLRRLLPTDKVAYLFHRISEGSDLLVPMDSFTQNLSEVKPLHIGLFQFAFGSSQFLNLQMEASPTVSDHTVYETTQIQWTMHARANIAPLQVFMIPLHQSVDSISDFYNADLHIGK